MQRRPRPAAAAGRPSTSSSTRPLDSTTTRSARNTASATSWVMKITVGRSLLPDAGQLLLQGHAGLRIDAGEGLVHQQHVGLVGQRAHHADALLHAAGELVGIALGGVRSGRPAPDIRARSRRARPSAMPRIFGPKATLSSTVFQGNSAKDWNTTPRSGPGPLTACPPTRISPPVSGMKPAIMLRIVVLPQPDGPTTETNSPCRDLERHVVHRGDMRRRHRDRNRSSTGCESSRLFIDVTSPQRWPVARSIGARIQLSTMYQSNAENDHAEQDLDHRAGAARIEHQEADAAGADDDLDGDQRAPAVAEAVAQAGDDVGQRAGQHDLPQHARRARRRGCARRGAVRRGTESTPSTVLSTTGNSTV